MKNLRLILVILVTSTFIGCSSTQSKTPEQDARYPEPDYRMSHRYDPWWPGEAWNDHYHGPNNNRPPLETPETELRLPPSFRNNCILQGQYYWYCY